MLYKRLTEHLALSPLVDASLVQVDVPVDGQARFGMLELMRDYALKRLHAAVRRSHADGDTLFISPVSQRALRPRYQGREYKKRSCSRKFPMSVRRYSGQKSIRR